MKLTFYLAIFAVFLVGYAAAAPPPSLAFQEVPHEDLQPLKRVARQEPPQPTQEFPPPPEFYDPSKGMPMKSALRAKREAKGGGSMPTRKG